MLLWPGSIQKKRADKNNSTMNRCKDITGYTFELFEWDLWYRRTQSDWLLKQVIPTVWRLKEVNILGNSTKVPYAIWQMDS